MVFPLHDALIATTPTRNRLALLLLTLFVCPSTPALAAESHRFAVVVETTGLPAAVTSRLELGVAGLLGEVPGAECVAPEDVRAALADARTETNQKCASGQLDSRCQIALGKGVDANYVAKLDVHRQGKSCDVVLSVFSIAEETQKASATALNTSCDSGALVTGLRELVDKVAGKLGLGRSGPSRQAIEPPVGEGPAAQTMRQDKASSAGSAEHEHEADGATAKLQDTLARAKPPDVVGGGDSQAHDRTAAPRRRAFVGRFGVKWMWSSPAQVWFTQSEVTVEQYESCVADGSCARDSFRSDADSAHCNWGTGQERAEPMNCVTWYGARAFCAAIGGSLPTEVQWVAEAFEHGRRPFPWGDGGPGCARAVMASDRHGCGREGMWPVCSKPRGHSVSGLCDMGGNVWEWLLNGDGHAKAVRGGGWISDRTGDFGSSVRRSYQPDSWVYDVGFRCVRATRE